MVRKVLHAPVPLPLFPVELNSSYFGDDATIPVRFQSSSIFFNYDTCSRPDQARPGTDLVRFGPIRVGWLTEGSYAPMLNNNSILAEQETLGDLLFYAIIGLALFVPRNCIMNVLSAITRKSQKTLFTEYWENTIQAICSNILTLDI